MRYYELLYIVNPNYEDDKVKSIIDEIGEEINKYKVSIINHHVWGKKRLAYPVKNNKYGIYILLQFGAEKFDFLVELERFLILNKSVIRHQVIKLDDEPKKVESIEEVVVETEPIEDIDSGEVIEVTETKADITDEIVEAEEPVVPEEAEVTEGAEEVDSKEAAKEEGE